MGAKMLLLLLFVWLTGCVSQEVRPPSSSKADFRHVNDMVELPALLAPLKGPVLLVLDIDDTLLTTPYLDPSVRDEQHRKFFGSDRWYVWLSDKNNPPDPADKLPCFYDVLEWNAQVATQVATEDDAADDIKALSTDKLVLTSRNITTRASTQRELTRATYSVQPLNPSKHPAIELYVGANGWMSYGDGVMMTNGSDKGDALIQLLTRHRLAKRYKTIVMLDDTPKNLDSVKAAVDENLPRVHFEGLNYDRIKKGAGPVREDEKEQARIDWTAWMSMMSQVYPQRVARIRSNECENSKKPAPPRQIP